MEPSKALLEALGVTLELTGTQMSAPAIRVMAIDLAEYPEPWVAKALKRCRRELKGRMSLEDVLSRIDDGRPGPEEAWAMLPKDEATTAIWTDEMAEAWGIAELLMDTPVQARMAFLEKYRELVREAREAKTAARWRATLGTDKAGREGPVLAAVEKGRLTGDQAIHLLPVTVSHDVLARIRSMEAKLLLEAA